MSKASGVIGVTIGFLFAWDSAIAAPGDTPLPPPLPITGLATSGGGGGTGTPGGSTGQLQTNAGGGNFGGITVSGDGTLNTTTGALVVTKTNGTAFGALATVTPGTGVATALAIAAGSSGGVMTIGGAMGTPSSGTLTNATGLPVSTGISGLGTGVATALAIAVGSAGGPVINGGDLGTPSGGTLTNATGLPVSTGISGLGTGVATALAIAVGSAGGPVTNGGALGTPSGGTLTNATGLPVSTGISGLGTGVATALATTGGTNGSVLINGGTMTTFATFVVNGSAAGAVLNRSDAALATNSAVGQLRWLGNDNAGTPVSQTWAIVQGQALATTGTSTNEGELLLQTLSGATLRTGITIAPNLITIATGTLGSTVATAISVGASGSVALPLIASTSAAQTGTVCWTTGTGALTVDTTTTCLASLEELKDIRAPIEGKEALDEISALRPVWGRWKKDSPEYVGDNAEQPFLTAHQVESVDPRLVGYDTEGKLHGVRYMEMSAIEVAAIQQLQTEIAELRERLH